jgi:hypothetical protein
MRCEFHLYVRAEFDSPELQNLHAMRQNYQKVHTFQNLDYAPRFEAMLTEQRHCSSHEQATAHMERIEATLRAANYEVTRRKIEIDLSTPVGVRSQWPALYYETHVPVLVMGKEVTGLTRSLGRRYTQVVTHRDPGYLSVTAHVSNVRMAIAEAASSGYVFCGPPQHEIVVHDDSPDQNVVEMLR